MVADDPRKTFLMCLMALVTLLGITNMASSASSSKEDDIKRSMTPFLQYLVAQDGKLSLDEVRASGAWQPIEGEPDFGYSQPDYWFYLDLTSLYKKNERQLLELSWLMNDIVDAYVYVDGELHSHMQSGDSLDFSVRALDHRDILFPIPLVEDAKKVEIYFHVFTKGTMKIPLFLWDEDDFSVREQLALLWHGLFFGSLAIMVLYNTFLFLVVRDISFLFYIPYILMGLSERLIFTGFAFQYLWPHSPELNNLVTLIVPDFANLFALLFTFSFLSLWHDKTWVKSMVLGMLVISALFIPLGLLMSYTDIIFLKILLVMMVLSTALIAGLKKWSEGMTAARFFCIAWLVFIIGIAITLSAFSGLLPINTFTLEVVVVAGILQMALHSIAFGDRFNEERSAKLKAQADNEAKGNFMAKMSHKIRTPMNGILGLAELLRFTDLKPQQKYYVEAIYNSGKALVKLINDVLDFSKIEAQTVELEAKPIQLNLLVNECISVFRASSKQGGVDINSQFDATLPDVVVGDSTRMRQVLLNLVSNAMKFTSVGEISIGLFNKERTENSVTVLFEISDTGIGVPADVVERLFEPFSQADASTTRVFGGTGLGLAICKELIELMGGEIGVRNNEDKGSTFWFTLRLQVADGALGQVDEVVESSTLAQDYDANSGLHVLVAEDNHVNQMVINGFLHKLGCEVIIVSNGVEAVEVFGDRHNEIDLVLMDCEMPEMDGFEATKNIRLTEKRSTLSRTPVVALTAHVIGDIAQRCKACGMDQHLTKPVSMEDIEALLISYFPKFGQVTAQRA